MWHMVKDSLPLFKMGPFIFFITRLSSFLDARFHVMWGSEAEGSVLRRLHCLTLGTQVFLECNSQQLSPPAVQAGTSGSCSSITPERPKVGNLVTPGENPHSWGIRLMDPPASALTATPAEDDSSLMMGVEKPQEAKALSLQELSRWLRTECSGDHSFIESP